MEAKLLEYRARRRREERQEYIKETFEKCKQKVSKLLPKIFTDMNENKKDEELVLIENEEIEAEKIPQKQPYPLQIEPDPSEVEDPEKQESWRYCITKWSLYAIIWLTLYAFFLRLQFGAVFFVISALIGIYLNTRTRPKRKGEVSAYSVFNDHCVSIDGTLKAEQFEREIRYGPVTVR